MSKQTAVEWLQEQLKKGVDFNPLDKNSYLDNVEKLFNQAKAMEREQIEDAWNGGDYAYFYSKETGRDFEDGSEYYNETYKGGEQ
jgi:hypothetical protein